MNGFFRTLLTPLRAIRNITGCTFAHPMNRGRRLAAVVTYVKWQIGGRLVPGPVVMNWVNGTRFMVRPGERGMTGNVYAGLEEYRDMGFLLHVLREGDFFADVGANVGAYSILAGAAVGAYSVAFEPVPSTFTRLVDNVRLNRCEERIRCVRQAVGAETGMLTLTDGLDANNRVCMDGERCVQTVSVTMTTLDDALAGEVPVLMKIDVEGYETAVLNGAQKTLANRALKAIIVELIGDGVRYGFDESRVFMRLCGEGFEAFTYDPFRRQLELWGGKRVSRNVIFVRDRAFVEERIVAAAEWR